MLSFFKKNSTTIYIITAFIFSLLVHLVWAYLHINNPDYFFNNTFIINTNDGYYFASGAQKELFNIHQENLLVPSMWDRGLVFITTLLAKVLPFSLDSIIFYLSAIISSLIVIPVILIGKLYNKPLWGFLSALLASVAWSYYNRTLVGYYDSDMLALIVPFFILYFLIKSAKEFSFKDALFASLIFAIYPFLYASGKSVAYALGIVYSIYMVAIYYKNFKVYNFLILILLSITPLHLPSPYEYIAKITLLIAIYFLLNKKEFNSKVIIGSTIAIAVLFLFSSNALFAIIGKVLTYTKEGVTDDSLHFFGVFQTISEANGIPFLPDPAKPYQSNVAYRVTGSILGFFLFLGGYIWLVIKKREFLLALPLVGIGLFAHWGGLRFTVYAVPIAALSIIYLIDYVISNFLEVKKEIKIAALILATTLLIYPNIQHTFKYNPGPVFTKNELQDLVKLQKIAKNKDFTLAWWDYGYPLWYYTNTNTLIDGGKHHHDNYIISKILLSSSPTLAANFSRLAVEEYVNRNKDYLKFQKDGKLDSKFVLVNKDGKKYMPGPYSPIIDNILRVNQKDQKDPNEFLLSLENNTINLPKKSRDIYLYAPFKMISILPTIARFSNIDLTTGKKQRDMVFLPLGAKKRLKNGILLNNNMIFDYKKGIIIAGKQKIPLKYFIVSKVDKDGNIKLFPKQYRSEANYVVVNLPDFGVFILMDTKTFKSNFVQMFLLGNYDKDLFELVIKSQYSRVYKVKK